MDALQREEKILADWKRRGEEAIQSSQITKQAYDNLLSQGLKSLDDFKTWVGAAVSTSNSAKTDDWRLGEGHYREIMCHAKSLKRIAKETQELNQHPLFRPDHWTVPGGIEHTFYPALRYLLDNRAEWIEKQLKYIAARRKSEQARKLQNPPLGLLIDLVRYETRRQHYSELSEILTAGAGIAGTKDDFSPDRLKQISARRAKRRRCIEAAMRGEVTR